MFQMQMTMDESGHGLFGEILSLVGQFIESKFDEKATFFDPVTQSALAAEALFSRQDDRWYLRYESLPGNLAVRAIGFDGKQLYLETGVYVDENLKKILDTEGLRYCPIITGGAEIKGANARMVLRSGKSVIPMIGDVMLFPRMLCTVSFGELDHTEREEIIFLLDKFFEAGVWSNPDPESIDASPAPVDQKVRQIQSTNLIQALEMEQRPLLHEMVQQQVQKVERRLDLQQNLVALFAFQRRILTAIGNGDRSALLNVLMECESRWGTNGTDNLTIFVRAGMYKKTFPNLEWPVARQRARADFYKHVRSA